MCEAGDLVEHPDCTAGEPRHGAHVILYCKQWMAFLMYSQTPMVVFRAHAARVLSSREPCVSLELRAITPKYKARIIKFMPVLLHASHNLRSAADHLESWIEETLVDGNLSRLWKS